MPVPFTFYSSSYKTFGSIAIDSSREFITRLKVKLTFKLSRLLTNHSEGFNQNLSLYPYIMTIQYA